MEFDNLINLEGKATAEGKNFLREDFMLLTKNNPTLSFGTVLVEYLNENNKQIKDLISIKDAKGKIRNHFFRAPNGNYADHNIILTYTGEKYDKLLCIDIDVNHNENETDAQKDGVNIFEKILKRWNCDTLKCDTPRGGRHYLFYLTDFQNSLLKLIGGLKTIQNIGLFGAISDILYDTGRAWMAGFVRKPSGVYMYKLLGKKQPAILPQFIFEELMINLKKLRGYKSAYDNILNSELFAKKRQEEKPAIKEQVINENTKDREIIHEYLKCLSPKRCSEYYEWTRIGMILFNEGCQFTVFNDWSKTCPTKYNEKMAKKIWDGFKLDSKKKLLLGTLIKFAREDNYNNYYTELCKKLVPTLDQILLDNNITTEIYDKFTRIMSATDDTSIASFFKLLFPDDYIYDTSQTIWYEANKHGIYKQCSRDEGLISARKRLSNDLVNCIERCSKAYIPIAFKNRDDKDVDKEKKKFYKNVNLLIKRLRTVSAKNNFIIELREFYDMPMFYKLQNPNKYLFAFENGVYDLKTHEFRNAKKEELVCGTTGYSYNKSTDEDRELIRETIRNMFLNDELYDYFMTIISNRLVKELLHEEIYFMIGDTCNGKGLVTTLIQNTFGDFTQVLEPASFTASKWGTNANAATPALASTHGTNIVFINELERGTSLSSDILKRLSGRDEIKVRRLHKECFQFVPTFNLFFVSNYHPQLDGTDAAIKRRLRYIPFNVTFNDNPVGPNQKKINYKLKTLFGEERFCWAFFDILIEFFKKYIDNDMILNVPNEVKDKSANLLDENNPVKSFISEKITITGNEKDTIKSSELYKLFKAFLGEGAKFSPVEFKKQVLLNNGIKFKETNRVNVFTNIELKGEEFSEEELEVFE